MNTHKLNTVLCPAVSGQNLLKCLCSGVYPPPELIENQLIACFLTKKRLFISCLLKTKSNALTAHWVFAILVRIKLFTFKNKIV